MVLERILKPWYVWRPSQLVSRTRLALVPPQPGVREVRTAWGVSLLAEPRTTIGWSIAATGVHDLTVTECLARLIRTGDEVLDVGAHIGYTASLARIAAGARGHVYAWEPNPHLYPLLERNTATVTKRYRTAAIVLRVAAVGAAPGTARLVLPDRESLNDATAHLNPGSRASDDSMLVAIETIDDVVGEGRVGVLKIDAEGSEAQVLMGARATLREGRIRHIIFEDHEGSTSETMRILASAGYDIFSIGWSLGGPRIAALDAGTLSKSYEAPNYVATLDTPDVMVRFAARGWTTLRPGFAKASLKPETQDEDV